MLDSAAAETMRQTTSSNSLFAFVFCNLIVLVIFLGSKFGSTDYGTRDALSVFGIHYDAKQAEIVDVERFSSDQIVCSSRPEKQGEEKLALAKLTEVWEGEITPEEEEDNNIECTDENENDNENKEDDGEEVNEDEDGNGDDELRRRIEDFIAKVNREREAENLKERECTI